MLSRNKKTLRFIALFILATSVLSCSNRRDMHTLSNNLLRVEISNDLSIVVLNKLNNKRYHISDSKEFQLRNIESNKRNSLFHCLYLPDSLNVTIAIALKDSSINFQLITDSLNPISKRISFPGAITVNTDDNFIVPYATGIIMPASDSLFLDEFAFWKHGATMAFVGVSNMKDSYMITSETPWDTGVEFGSTTDSLHYTIQAFHEPCRSHFGYNRSLNYTFISKGSYVEMCKIYRSAVEEKGYTKTLKEKAIANPNVEKLKGAVDFWIMKDQFRTPKFITQLYNFGVDKALFSLSGGWYSPNSYSQLIDTINALGYLSSRYDLLTDVWPTTYPELKEYRTSGFPEKVVIDKNNNLYKGWVAFPKKNTPFQGYIICSDSHADYIDNRLSEELVNSHYNARFLDVELSLHLLECYSTEHPTSRHQDALNRIKTLNVVKEKHSLVTGSEEAYDWAFPELDFSEGTMSVRPEKGASYNWSSPVDSADAKFIKYNINPALKVPLHSLVYHDVHIPTWYTGDGVSKVPAYWDDKDLFNILYGTMPLFLPPNYEYWEKKLEKFLTTYHLVATVFNEVGFAKMTNHHMLTDDKQVQMSNFDNGWKAIVNFSNIIYTHRELNIPSKGFYASNGVSEVSRLKIDGNNLAIAQAPNKLFINPYGITQSYRGIRSNGSVVLIKHNNYIQIAFIGNQSYIDIRPESLPWTVSTLKIQSNNLLETPIKSIKNGWFRIYKQGDMRFYRINN